MADDKLRELERAYLTGGDRESKRAFLRELVRSGDPRVNAAQEARARIEAVLEQTRASLRAGGDYTYEPHRCPRLKLDQTLRAVEAALRDPEDPDQDFGWGFQTLARAWPQSYRAGDNREAEDFSGFVNPLTVMAFAASVDGEVTLGIGVSDARKASPGTVFSALAPWRIGMKPTTLRRKIGEWREVLLDDRRVDFGVETARLMLDLATMGSEDLPQQAEPVVPMGDPPSEAQRRFMDKLLKERGLEGEALQEQLERLAGVSTIEALDKGSASSVIDGLLELPKASAKKKTAKKKATKAKTAKVPAGKLAWRGEVLAVQPRIRLRVVLDDEQHSYQGYVLRLLGSVGEEQRTFTVGVGKAAQKKHGFRPGDIVSGQAAPVADPGREAAELYKASKLKVESRGEEPSPDGPPWTGAPPELPDYRAQGHRTLAADAFQGDCGRCLWACRMPIEGDEEGMSLECYGPRDCPAFRGP